MKGNDTQNSGYLAQSRHSGSSLALVIGLHGAALALAFLVKAGVVPLEGETDPPVVTMVPTPPIPQPIEQAEDPTLDPPPTPHTSETIVDLPPIRLTESGPDLLPPPPVPTGPIHFDPPPPVPVIRDARLIQNGRLQPAYPSNLIRQDIEGSCTIRVRVGPNGRVAEAIPLDATHPAFCEATQRHAMRRWRFEPATRDGVPVESWQQHVVQFRIR